MQSYVKAVAKHETLVASFKYEFHKKEQRFLQEKQELNAQLESQKEEMLKIKDSNDENESIIQQLKNLVHAIF